MSEAYDDFDFDDDGPDEIGCYECEDGWRHGCCDDLCRGSVEAVDCDAAHPCRLCNPRGEVAW
jgi:hypothetical protein